MSLVIELGIPYCDILSQKEFEIELVDERTVGDAMDSFLEHFPKLVRKANERGFLRDGRLKAIYTQNGKLVSEGTEIGDGDYIKVIFPIAGG